jgi:hypothetical protein
MREWIEELSEYMENQERASPLLADLSEEVHQAVLETDFLLEASDQLQTAYAALIEKVDDGNS